jgi:hypothetical protein
MSPCGSGAHDLLPPPAGATANSNQPTPVKNQDSTAGQGTRPVRKFRIALSAYRPRVGNDARQGVAAHKSRHPSGRVRRASSRSSPTSAECQFHGRQVHCAGECAVDVSAVRHHAGQAAQQALMENHS